MTAEKALDELREYFRQMELACDRDKLRADTSGDPRAPILVAERHAYRHALEMVMALQACIGKDDGDPPQVAPVTG